MPRGNEAYGRIASGGMRPLRAGVIVGLACALVALASCRAPTEITIEGRTNVTYDASRGFAVAWSVGTPGQVESASPTTETRAPWGADGVLGTLVAVPGGAKDEAVSVRVVLAVGRDPALCTIASPEGCIVARRTLRYVPHENLSLPIVLYAACIGVPCTADSTCNAFGECVPANVDPTTCVDCIDRLPDGGSTFDGATTSEDGASPDVVSAPPDPPQPFPPATPPPVNPPPPPNGDGGATIDDSRSGYIGCGALSCSAGTRCCWDANGRIGGCITSGQTCTATVSASCDGPEDCTTTGGLCCNEVTGPVCDVPCGTKATVCHADADCPPPLHCTNVIYGAYKECQ